MSGEGKIDGASGARIKSQLQSIVNQLNSSSATKIKFQYEFDVKKVEKEINNATKKAAEPKTSKYSKGLVNYYKDLEKQSDSFNKKNISGIDFEIKKREESSRRFSRQMKEQMTEAERLKNAVSNSQNALLGMGGNADERTYANTGIKAVTDAYEKYLRIVKEAQVAEKAIDSNNPQTQQAFIDKVNEAKIAQQQLNAVLHNSTAFEKQETVYQKVIARITEYQAKFKETLKNTPQLAAQLEELRQKLDSNTFVGTENKANQMFVSLTNQIRQAGGEAETLAQKIKRIFGKLRFEFTAVKYLLFNSLSADKMHYKLACILYAVNIDSVNDSRFSGVVKRYEYMLKSRLFCGKTQTKRSVDGTHLARKRKLTDKNAV